MAITFSYIFGSVSSLIMGTGMSLVIGVGGGNTFTSILLGIIIGLIGIAMVSVNYSIYKKILASSKRKYKDRIKKLSNELLNK